MNAEYTVIIDGSYFIYYNLFSAWSAYRKDKGIEVSDPDFNPTTDTDFVDIYSKRIHSRLKFIKENLIKNFISESELDTVPFIFTTDCSHKTNWRMDIFPGYKVGRREGPPPDFNVKEVFRFGLQQVLKNEHIQKTFKLMFVDAPHAEGDDIIAVLLKHSKSPTNILIANDRDFLQLADKTKIIGLDSKEVTIESFCEGETLSVEDFILFKILLGDPSDSLPNVFPGKGKKRCMKLVKDKAQLQELLENTDGALERFERNSALMDMKNIPDHIEKEILTQYLSSLREYNNELMALDNL
jgi:5'-3' exonuclease